MAVPSIISIVPSIGSTIGSELIEVKGNDFQLPPAPPPTGVVPVAAPTVEVTFGGVSATAVFVITPGRLLVQTPKHAEGDVDVVVNNIDTDGDVIPGETVTEVDGFKFLFPNLAVEADLTALVRQVLQFFKTYLHPNVSLTVHTDYDSSTSDGLNITEVAEFPHIVLIGPELVESRFYSLNENSVVSEVGGAFDIQRESRTVDAGFDVLLLSDNTQELLNLTHHIVELFHKIKFFAFSRPIPNPDCSDETFELDIQAGEQFRWDSDPNESNVRQVRGAFIIRGFTILGPVVGKGAVLGESQINGEDGVEDPVLEETEQTGETFAVGASPGPGGDC